MRLNDRVAVVGSGMMGFDLTDPYDCHVYLLDGGDELALIDAGAGVDVEPILAMIQRHGYPLDKVKKLILTHQHADHAGGAAALKERLGVEVMMSAESAHFLEDGDEAGVSVDLGKAAGFYPADYVYRACPVDRKLKEGDIIRVGECQLLTLETPGHCNGHLSFLMEEKGFKTLFAGDAIFFGGRVILQNIPDCSIPDHIQSIYKLEKYKIDALLPGHLTPSLQRGHRHIQEAAERARRLGAPLAIF